jgi:acyl-CoA thioesterase II
MRPHEGFGQGQAHETVSTGVLTHTLTFHEEVDATRWHLFVNDSVHAGHGRTYGTGNVFSRDGRLVASFAQENMLRRFRADDTRRGTAVGVL